MDPGDLARRLGLIREQRKTGTAARAPSGIGEARGCPALSPSASGGMEEWDQVAPGVWRSVTCRDLAGAGSTPAIRAILALARARGIPGTEGSRIWLDTETTGLSGGAGTFIFLNGWARLRPDGLLEATRYFLADFPSEPGMVDLCDADLAALGEIPGFTMVTYNGSTFDIPLLRTRWIMNGRMWSELPHRDRLHDARRLWKGLWPSCTLGNLESRVLGVERQGDPGGAMAPVLYFAWLKEEGTPFTAALGGILEHHLQDLASLCALDLLVGLLEEPGDTIGNLEVRPGTGVRPLSGVPGGEGVEVDPRGWYLHLLRRGCRAEARQLCARGWEGDPCAWWGHREASWREGHDRLGVLEGLWDRTGDAEALRKALILREHRMGDPGGALTLLRSALQGDGAPAGPEWDRRLARLERKISRT